MNTFNLKDHTKNQIPNFAPDLMPRTLNMKSSADTSWLWKRIFTLASCLLGVVVLAGCASTKVTNKERLVYEFLPKPAHIYVYDFSASPTDVAKDSVLAGQTVAAPPNAELAMLGQQLGSTIAARLVDSIREMGLPAERGVYGQNMQPNDIVIRGYLVSVEQGSAAKRMTIGFGSGGSELTTFIEGYQVTAQGLRKLGSATMEAKGNKGPGAGVGAATWAITGSPVGLAVSGGIKLYGEASGSATVEGRAKQTAKEIAEKLKHRFQEEGWIAR
jgi:hypothetical protein